MKNAFFTQLALLLILANENLCASLASGTYETPAKSINGDNLHSTPIDSEFDKMPLIQVKLTGSNYKKLFNQAMGTSASDGVIDPEFATMKLVQARLAATKWKRQLEKVTSRSTSVTSVSDPLLDLSESRRNLSKEFEEISTVDVTRDTSPSSSPSNGSASGDLDQTLHAVFKDANIVSAYKSALESNDFHAFWAAIKGKVLAEILTRVEKIQPGNVDSVFLIEYSRSPVYYAFGAANKTITKKDFLQSLQDRISRLNCDDIPLPKNLSEIGAFYLTFLLRIKTAVERLIDDMVPGDDDNTILPADIQSNVGNNLTAGTKRAVKDELGWKLVRGMN